MSKKHLKQTNIEKKVMEQISSNQIAMKPKWYFVLGSTTMLIGLVASMVTAIFAFNLLFFLLRQHGPRGIWRLEFLLMSFPLWVPVVALAGSFSGIWLLKKYDFSYKKNFVLIAASFVAALIIAAIIIDISGLNRIWFKRGPMRRLYLQSIQQDFDHMPRGNQLHRQQKYYWE